MPPSITNSSILTVPLLPAGAPAAWLDAALAEMPPTLRAVNAVTLRTIVRRVARRRTILYPDSSALSRSGSAVVVDARPPALRTLARRRLEMSEQASSSWVAPPRYLLAMKLLASRVERDQYDIRALCELCGFRVPKKGSHSSRPATPSTGSRRVPASCWRRCTCSDGESWLARAKRRGCGVGLDGVEPSTSALSVRSGACHHARRPVVLRSSRRSDRSRRLRPLLNG